MEHIYHRITSFVKYYFRAQSIYSLHSPFLYRFYNEVFRNDRTYYSFYQIEQERKNLLNSTQEITFLEMGAGYHGSNTNQSQIHKRKISEIARSSLSNKKQGRLLFHLVNLFQPQKILEFGTSLGISTAYLASAKRNAQVLTIEGNLEVQKKADQIFDNLGLTNIHCIHAIFDEYILSSDFQKIQNIDMVYIDGNHTYTATKKYFEAIFPKLSTQAIIIIDDIYWSKEMTRIWQELKNNSAKNLMIDIFELGIIFINSSSTPLDITLIEFWKKPWKIGIFP